MCRDVPLCERILSQTLCSPGGKGQLRQVWGLHHSTGRCVPEPASRSWERTAVLQACPAFGQQRSPRAAHPLQEAVP